MMNSFARGVAVALLTGLVTAASAQDLAGAWTLRIQDLAHKQVSVLTVRFSDQQARSCIGGDWRRVVVESAKTEDKKFFPVDEPLSYRLSGQEVTIGRNEVCDGYLRLSGALKGDEAQGAYYSMNVSASQDLGFFVLNRRP